MFEEHAPRSSKALRTKELQDAADAFLRLHDKRMVANPPPEAEDKPKPLAGGAFGGKSWRKDLGDKTDWRGELRTAADAGDENAQWRCWNLFDAPDEDEAAEKDCA
jgi:hypothetical protein